MSFAEKIKKALGLDDEDDFDMDEEIEEEEPYQQERPPRRARPSRERASQQDRYIPPRTDRRASAPNDASQTKVVDIHTTAKVQMVLKKPENFDEATAIADQLLERRTVVLNMEGTNKTDAGKLLCFLSGVAYANGGKIKKISDNNYIITPYNVDLMGDLLDEIENNGFTWF